MTSMPLRPLRERRRDTTLLELSTVAVELFLARGVDGTTIGDIARAAGVSTRTFHRYFPAKVDAVGPELQQGLQRYLDSVATTPVGVAMDELVASLADALSNQLTGPAADREVPLLHLAVTSPALLPVWLRLHEECAQAMAPLLAERVPGLDPLALRYLSGSVVMANRLAVETWVAQGGDVRDHLRRCLSMLPGLTATPHAV